MKKKEKKYGLLKGALLFIVIAFILTWLIPNGGFGASGFESVGMNRLGIDNFGWMLYYAIYYSIDKIVLLLVIGGLYGMLSRIKAYDDLVTNIANKIKHKEVFVVIVSVLIAALASILVQGFVLIIFIPFILAIMNKLKLDKLTALATTFGSLLIGVMGATYGSEGVMYLNPYLVTAAPDLVKKTLLVRVGILVVGLVLFNFFNIIHMKKVKGKEESTEMFPMEIPKESKSKTAIPIVVIGLLVLVIAILGYVDWVDNFGINVFTKFHESVMKVSLGKDFFIFKAILGTDLKAFGEWEVLFSMISYIVLFTIILALCYRVKLEEFISSYASGMKRVLKPILCVLGAWLLLVVVYMSPYVATIINRLLSFTDGFNLATMVVSGLITNIFHTDLGFTGYVMGNYIATEYIDHINPIYVIIISLYGFVQLFIPTSAILGIGITSLDVKYKDWLKYIWRFLLGMFICLLIIFILITII